MSNPAYLQNFGKLHKDMRKREVNDTMSASGRWDDLYLRASKPRIKQGRRQGMRRDLTISLKGGPSFKVTSITGQVTQALGLHCDPVTVKYKLDSPSYPSRHRELSQQDRVNSPRMEMRVVGVRHVYDVLAELIIKLRFRAPNEFTTRTFRALWANRHALKAKATLPRKSEMPKTAVVSQPVPARVEPPKAKPRKVAKAIYEEYEKIKKYLRHLDAKSQLAHESWDKKIAADRQEALRRQRVLLSIIEAGK